MTLRVLCLLCVLLPVAQANDPKAAPSEVTIGRTPGKPMQLVKAGEPAEAITARVTRDGGYELVITRNVGSQPEDYKQTVVELTATEWEQVFDLLVKLDDWKPDPADDEVMDWGSARLAIKAGSSRQTRSWSKPLKNQEAIDPLWSHLAKLAKQKVKEPKLFYFGG